MSSQRTGFDTWAINASTAEAAVVRGRDGYLRVFYDKLGLEFQTYDRWIASGARLPAAAGTQH